MIIGCKNCIKIAQIEDQIVVSIEVIPLTSAVHRVIFQLKSTEVVVNAENNNNNKGIWIYKRNKNYINVFLLFLNLIQNTLKINQITNTDHNAKKILPKFDIINFVIFSANWTWTLPELIA